MPIIDTIEQPATLTREPLGSFAEPTRWSCPTYSCGRLGGHAGECDPPGLNAEAVKLRAALELVLAEAERVWRSLGQTRDNATFATARKRLGR